MNLVEIIEDWKKFPNALGSEARIATIIGSICADTGEDIPDEVKAALKTLALRGTMRDIASALSKNNSDPHPRSPSFHNVVDTAANSCGLSWTEALATLTKFIDEYGASRRQRS